MNFFNYTMVDLCAKFNIAYITFEAFMKTVEGTDETKKIKKDFEKFHDDLFDNIVSIDGTRKLFAKNLYKISEL